MHRGPAWTRAAFRNAAASWHLALTALLAAVALGACASLPAYDDLVERLGSGSFVEVEGARIYVETLGEPGTGSPVVLVHGYGASSYSWRHVLPALAERHQVVALDLVGFGLTERPKGKNHYSRTGQVDVLSAVVDHFGWPSAHFVGHSYGGGLVMSLAHLEPDKVRSMVLVGSTVPVYSDKRRHIFGRRPFAPPLVRAFLRPSFVRRSLRRSFYDDRAVTDELIASYLERVRVEGVTRAYVGLTAPAPSDERFDDLRYETLGQPTLAIWGSHDVLIPSEGARKAIGRFPDARFIEITECGHIPMEEKPDELVAEVLPFFAEVDSAVSGVDPARTR
ncbi:MAG: alpha/beta hydrolase [bacterium]|nr:alpha/beta hydrolase [bacterium]